MSVQCSQLLLQLCKNHVEIHAFPSSQPGFEPALCYCSGKCPKCSLAFSAKQQLWEIFHKRIVSAQLELQGPGVPCWSSTYVEAGPPTTQWLLTWRARKQNLKIPLAKKKNSRI